MPSPLIRPIYLLLIAMAITAGAVAIVSLLRRRRRSVLLELARQWQMHYSSIDLFNLAARVAGELPIAGAADVFVHDLIYGTEPAGHRCIFCAEYTTGIVRSKCRRRCVVSLLETRKPGELAPRSIVQVAPGDLPLIEQYRMLRDAKA